MRARVMNGLAVLVCTLFSSSCLGQGSASSVSDFFVGRAAPGFQGEQYQIARGHGSGNGREGQELSAIETTSNEWAQKALHEMKGWRFHPASANGQAVETKGFLEVVYAPSGVVRFSTTQAAGTGPGATEAFGPDSNWQPTTAQEFLARGYARLRLRKAPQAQADAIEALRLQPNLASALFLRGRSAYETKDYQEAIADFDKVIRQKPDWPDVYRNRGLAHMYCRQQQQALEDFKKAIELDPNSAPSYNALGWAFTETGQWDTAKKNLDQALELDPSFAPARENRVKLFAKQGDLTAERDELTVLLAQFPSNQWAKDTKEALTQKMR